MSLKLRKKLDLNYDGMIIETHIDPDNAWSDAACSSKGPEF
jgi:3-deoxy-D-manno-octulosonic acid (KDO) 8-phosphate synthase